MYSELVALSTFLNSGCLCLISVKYDSNSFGLSFQEENFIVT